MTGHDHDLLRMLAPANVGNDVVSGGVRQSLRSQDEMHPDLPLTAEMRDQVGVLVGEGSSRNSRWRAVPSVGKTKACATHRSNQRRDRAQLGRSLRAAPAINDGFAVCIQRESRGSLLPIEGNVEENDLPRQLLATEGGKLIEVAYNHHLGRDPVGPG